MNAAQQSVHPTCGSLRRFWLFFWLWAFPAPRAHPRSAHPRVTHTVGRPEENASVLFEREGVSSTHTLRRWEEQEMSPRYDGGAECAPGRPAHEPAPQLRRTRYAGHASLPTQKTFLIRAPQMFRSVDSKESCSQSQTAAQHSVHPTCGSLRHLQAFSWLRAFPAPKHCPRPPWLPSLSRHTQVTQTVVDWVMLARGSLAQSAAFSSIFWLSSLSRHWLRVLPVTPRHYPPSPQPINSSHIHQRKQLD
jgi:hypothetical protein